MKKAYCMQYFVVSDICLSSLSSHLPTLLPLPSSYSCHLFSAFYSSLTPQQGSSIATQQSSLADAVSTALTALSDPGPVTDLASAVNTISQQNAIQHPLHYAQFLGSLQTVLSAAKSVQGQVGNLTALRSTVDASNQVRLHILWFLLTDVCVCIITALSVFVYMLRSVTNLYNRYVVVDIYQNMSARCHTQSTFPLPPRHLATWEMD